MPDGPDHFLQFYALVVVLVMAELFVVELVAPQPTWPLHLFLIGVVFFLLVILSICFKIPAEGKMATGLHWVAITSTTFLSSVLIAAAKFAGDSENWATKKVVKFYTVVLLIDILIILVLWVLFP